MSERRLDKLIPALNARERAKLVLQSLKDGTEEDPLIRSTIPSEQVDEFNRYIKLMNGINLRLGPLIIVIRQGVETVSQRIGWLLTVTIFESTNDLVQMFLLIHAKEPITESEYEVRRLEAEAELIPINELAELEADAFEDWAREDLEMLEDGREVVSDAAWEKQKQHNAALLRRLIDQGALVGKRTRRGLCIRADSYYRWKGEVVPVLPDLGASYDVLADSEADLVRRWRADREAITEAFSLFSGGSQGEQPERPRQGLTEVRTELSRKVVEGSQHYWLNLDASRRVIEEVAEEFDGEDPCRSELREILGRALTEIQELASKGCPGALEPFELPEPSEEQMAEIRQLVLRDD